MSAFLLLQQAGAAAPAAPATDVQSSGSAELPLWGNLALGDPWFLVLVPLVIAGLLWSLRRRARAGLDVSLAPLAAAQGLGAPTLRQRLAFLGPCTKAAALLACVLALTRPLSGSEERDLSSEGVDILLCIDRSGSMRFQDLEAGKTRLDVVKRVVGDFAERRMTGQGGTRDNVGLVVFARFPEMLCPFTLDINALSGFLATVKMAEREEEDGTAIGAGLAKSVAALRDSRAKSKVVVLLTDGENNIADIEPAEAARLAASEKVKVYTVMAGRYVYKQDIFGLRETDEELDSHELEAIASETGGRFFRARDKQGLERVYDEIDRLERTPQQEKRYVETYDLYPWLLVPGLALYLLSWLWAATLGRQAP